MKKRALLLMATLFVFAFNTKVTAQKSGILQKDHYGAFTGNDWEDFLAGKRAADFEKKSNVTLKNYLEGHVTRFVTEELGESTIASAVMNSTVVAFPEGSDVYTADADGNWKTRKAYPGERGYMHTQTRICWLSFQCGNLVKSVFSKPATPPAQPYQKPENMVNTGNPQPGSNSNTLTFNPPAQNQGSTWEADYAKFSAGMGTMQMAYQNSFFLFKAAQDAKECCKQTAPAAVVPTQVVYAQPGVLYSNTAPAPQQGNYNNTTNNGGGYSNNNGHLDVTVREKVKWTEAANFGLNVINTGLHAYTAIHGQDININGLPNTNYGGYNNGNFPVSTNSTLFNGSSVLGYSAVGTGLGTTIGLSNNPTIYRNDRFPVR